MTSPLSMFTERKERGEWSMTRVVAWIFALTYCAVLLRNADTVPAMGWPFCALGVVVLLAVPLQALFKTLQTWAMTPSGKALVQAALAKVTTMTTGTVPSTTETTVTTSTKPSTLEEAG